MLGVRRDTSYNTLEPAWGVIVYTPQACEPTLVSGDCLPNAPTEGDLRFEDKPGRLKFSFI